MAKPPSLLFDTIIPAIDQGGYDIWDIFDDDQKKSAKGDFWNLNRYISNVKSSNREIQEHFVLTTNEFYNKNWNDIQKHPKLVWQTLCLCSHESKKPFFHEWIPLKKQKNKKVEFLAELFPDTKMSDIETMAAITNDKEIKAYCEKLGWDKKQVNAIKF
jgi:Cft2 family RNA processing exonuclease